MKFFFKQILKVSAFYLEKQKSFFAKKNVLSHCQYQNKKALFTDPIFSEDFRQNSADWDAAKASYFKLTIREKMKNF